MARLLFLGVLPFSLLVFFNYRIHYEMRLPSIIQGLPVVERSARRNQEKELAKVLIAIVVIFIFCHTLRVFTDFYEMINVKDIIACNNAGRFGVSNWIILLNYFSKLMIATNASVSTLIYCLTNKSFRKKMFKSHHPETLRRTTTNNHPSGMRENHIFSNNIR